MANSQDYSWALDIKELEEKQNKLVAENHNKYKPLVMHLKTKYVDVAVGMDRFRPGVRWCPAEKAFTWDSSNQLGGQEQGEMVVSSATKPTVNQTEAASDGLCDTADG